MLKLRLERHTECPVHYAIVDDVELTLDNYTDEIVYN